MINTKKITIVTVTFNSEEYLSKTIESVLNQNYSNYEYIIVDGLSSDDTLKIIKSYEPSFNGKLKWISEKDDGIYDAMNKGICMASGQIIGLVNSDDYLDKDALVKVSKYYNDNTIVTGLMTRVDSNGNEVYSKAHKGEKYYFNKLNYTIPFSHPASFIPVSVYDDIGLYDINFPIQADYDFFFRCLQNEIEFNFINETLTYYREGGISDKNHFKRLSENYRIRKKYQKGLPLFVNSLRYINKLAKGVIIKLFPSFIVKKYYRNKYSKD